MNLDLPSVLESKALPTSAGGAAVPAQLRGAAAWELCASLLAATGQGFAVKDASSGRYEHVNDVLAAWMGCRPVAIVGQTDAELFDAAAASALRAADQAAIAQGGSMSAEHRLTFGDTPRDLAVWRLAQPGAEGDPSRLVSVWIDQVPARQQAESLRAALAQIEILQSANEAVRRELADHALRDNASGLYTKAHFDDQLRREVDLSSREHREFAVVFVEIDDASVPARSAQATRALQGALGRLLRGGTRAMDAACRLDERRFAVLLSGVGLATAHSRMEGLRRRCATDIVVHEGHEMRFTVAMGVASFPHTAHTQAELLEACAAALQEAKRRGGNHVALAAIRLDPAV